MPKPKGHKVYLDHHIIRENLLYRKAGSLSEPLNERIIPLLEGESTSPSRRLDQTSFAHTLKVQDLNGRRSRALRKPDFQRATWAWTPEECVDLLESVIYEKVVPSVIMWLSPDNFQYVLDGAHRISVLLAWIRDDWGDKIAADVLQDPQVQEANRASALKVREMLRARSIGTYKEWEDAESAYEDLEDQKKNPKDILDFQTLRYVERLRRWNAVEIGFPILWVHGDQAVAEQSFLKINKTGRQLSEWETKLVENRTSSFARTVMSVSQISGPEHCWTTNDPEIDKEPALKKQVTHVLELVHKLHELVFEPPFRKPIDSLRQPLLTTSATNPENKPTYLAELLTVSQGRKGQKAEMESLIKKDSGASPAQIIANGEKLLEDAIDVITEIHGKSPRSMALIPLLYYYNKQGRHVRNLLLGMIYWITKGTAVEVTNRKFCFTIHRRSFETVLREYKEQIIRRLGRRIGSGPEVTLQTARYFDGLLKLLIEHKDDTASDSFVSAHKVHLNKLGKVDPDEELEIEEEESSSRTFRNANRDAVDVRDLLDNAAKCEICGGMYSPGGPNQVDHREKHSDGGKTALSNARNTHPFCNHRRTELEEIQNGSRKVELPPFEKTDVAEGPVQLTFLAAFEEGDQNGMNAENDDFHSEVSDSEE